MYSNKLYSPLRYPGGKARFAPFIAEVMRANGLADGHYLEPFAGGAGVALELLFDGHASHIHINDLDPAVFAFWSAATTDPDGILKLLRDTPITMEQWHHWRSVMLAQDPERHPQGRSHRGQGSDWRLQTRCPIQQGDDCNQA